MKNYLLGAACLMALGACQRDDPIFGQSYDACLLHNATKGGDDQSRATAVAVCERHFLRAATPEESNAARSNAVVTYRPQGQGDNVPHSGESDHSDPLEDVFDNDKYNQISAPIRNDNENVIVKEVRIDAYFHNGPPTGINGTWKADDPGQHLHWKLSTTIAPGDIGDVMGTFGDEGPPSRYYKAIAFATMVVPESEKTPSHLVEKPD
jgi:hypothetical protein